MYSKKQAIAVAEELRKKFVEGIATAYEIVLLLLIMEKEKRMNVEMVTATLMTVFDGDKENVLKALGNAKNQVTDKLIEEIVADIYKEAPPS